LLSAQASFNKAQEAKLKKTNTMSMSSINLPHQYPNNAVIGGGLVINNNGIGGSLGANIHGNLTWNNNPLGSFDKPTVSRISEMIKDGLSREIVLCESREACKEKYGSYGVKLFDSMLNEVLQEAIKSEEIFNLLLQTEYEKVSKLKEFISDHVGITDEVRQLLSL
jgi:hypothetical protein